MAINVNNPEADALTRRFAAIEGVSLTDAIVIAMTEAIERRRSSAATGETPKETAARIRARHGIQLKDAARRPLPREAFDALWGQD